MVLQIRGLIENSPPDVLKSTEKYVGFLRYKQIISRAKILSQILTFLWLRIDDKDVRPDDKSPNRGIPEKAVEWFRQHRPSKGLSDLERLMIAKPEDDSEYGQFLNLVFPEDKRRQWNQEQKEFYKFPIFNEEDIYSKRFSLELDPNIFDGYFTDPDKYSDSAAIVVIAFPPRPPLNPMTVTSKELNEWVNNHSTDPKDFLPPSPYIPTCCC